MTGGPELILRVGGLHAWADGRPVLQDIVMTLAKGEVGCLSGANGCGKTTLARILAGISTVSFRGDIECARADEPLPAEPAVAFAVPPEWLPAEITGHAAMVVAASALGVTHTAHADAYATLVGLDPYLARPIGSYSLGTRQKLAIALAFLAAARLLILDEALNALDKTSRLATLDFVRSWLSDRRGAALLVTHDTETIARIADVVWFMVDGRIEETRRQRALPVSASPAEEPNQSGPARGPLSGLQFRRL